MEGAGHAGFGVVMEEMDSAVTMEDRGDDRLSPEHEVLEPWTLEAPAPAARHVEFAPFVDDKVPLTTAPVSSERPLPVTRKASGFNWDSMAQAAAVANYQPTEEEEEESEDEDSNRL
jgi:hypothetical protein